MAYSGVTFLIAGQINMHADIQFKTRWAISFEEDSGTFGKKWNGAVALFNAHNVCRFIMVVPYLNTIGKNLVMIYQQVVHILYK